MALQVYSLKAEEDEEEEEDLVYTAEMQQFANDISALLTTLAPQRTKVKIAGQKTCKLVEFLLLVTLKQKADK